jgi:hypothetical protein
MAKHLFCKIFGHKWLYRDFTNAVKANGESYQYTKMRKCVRCEDHEYLYAQWVSKDMRYPIDKDEGFLKKENSEAIF